jgi:hypothetical protein
MRYVHLPIGYDGVPRAQALRIARAVRDLPGPVYLHCHHGKHRGPAAAAMARFCLDSTCDVGAAVALMRQAGTDPRYVGLYESPRLLRRPTAQEIDQVPLEFPTPAKVDALAERMVAIEQHWEHLRQVRAAGWKVPARHPDIDPPHEALQLAEHYREAARLPENSRRPEALRRWLAGAAVVAHELEEVLRQHGRATDRAAAEALFGKAAAACVQCHAKYRDLPRQGGDR